MKYDLCVKSGTYTDRNGNEKTNWENIGVMVDDGSRYILLKPFINLAGFQREEGRSYLIVSMFEHKDNDQRNSRNSEREDFSTDNQNYDPDKIPF